MGTNLTLEETCTACKGLGKIGTKPCQNCQGTGTVLNEAGKKSSITCVTAYVLPNIKLLWYGNCFKQKNSIPRGIAVFLFLNNTHFFPYLKIAERELHTV